MPRVIEVLIAAVALVVLAPVLLLVAVLVRTTSRGPVLYGQSRLGRDGATFTLLKFRTMRVGAEAHGRLTVGADDRITGVGRFLRGHRLDELPQLVNVLRGDMALVGARPEVPEFVMPDLQAQRDVLRQRPGLTDPASLAYRHEAELLAAQPDPEAYYRSVLLPAKVQLSGDYARVRTLRSDLVVLLRTAACLVLPSARSRQP
jgi:lipopolysaccharide/colanic/teichoic acid biosynthesis glycosyltransferase